MNKRQSLGKKIRFEVFKRDKFTCQYCGKSAPNVILEVDHIDPVAKGGRNELVNLITSCADCNRGKSDRTLSDDSAVIKQRNQLELIQDRREQIELMFQWRRELDRIDEDTLSMVISYIEGKLLGFSINESGQKRLFPLTKKYELADVLDAVDISANKYLQYAPDGELTQESAEAFLNKIGGILVNKNRPPVEQKASYIKGICRNKFSYWNARTGSIILNNYISALRSHGWTDEQIANDLEDELKPETIKCKNWSEWRGLIEKWTEDVTGWATKEEDAPFQPTIKDLNETADELFNERENIVPALEYLGKVFDSFERANLVPEIDRTIINFLTSLEEHYASSPNADAPPPRHFRSAKALLALYSPVESWLTYWLDNAVCKLITDLVAPISFYIEENPRHEYFRAIAARYVELMRTHPRPPTPENE